MTDPSFPDHVAAAEAILFVSPGPLKEEDLGRILNITDGETLQKVIAAVESLYAGEHRGIVLQRVSGGFRLATAARLEPYVLDTLQRTSSTRLSQAALEVLAIVAYRQPITVPEISAVRGVNSAGVVETLIQKNLLRTAGRKHVVGRPFLYKTTQSFLIHFGLDSLDDLPPIDELREDETE
ncbi:MAG TPA: SMC-Scp complex subunit ScpB [Thermoanaerobaculia bacterium]|nr:SMC-Scp complex subunit ScpB [Thermoanaerobaculia bacterium]HUM29596.1 SMC-Scp complex subunit ScpB [Thermoanaerobaculia bacterium]HXK67247.1 SMC-Scp complex subunit ScpB [Thermoanaerobaculia bacterium]